MRACTPLPPFFPSMPTLRHTLLGALACLLAIATSAPLRLRAQEAAPFLFPEEEATPPVNANRRAGQEALAQGLYKNAVRYFTLALKDSKEDGERAELSLLLARSLLLDGQPKEALRQANETLTAQPAEKHDPLLRDRLRLVAGLASVRLADFATALNFLLPLRDSPLMKESPAQRAQILEALAQAWNAGGQWEETRKTLADALPQFDFASPERIALTWSLLDATLPQGRWQDTRSLLDELAAQPASQERQALAKLLRLRCDIGEGKIPEANQYYHASQLNTLLPKGPAPQWWEVLSSLAQECQARGMAQEAAALFGDAAQVAPDQARSREAQGFQAEALVASGSLPEAKAVLTRLHEALPSDAAVTLRLAEVRMALQERLGAAELFQGAAQDTALPRPRRFQALLKSALCLSQEGLSREAAEAFRQAADMATTPQEQGDALLRAAKEEERNLRPQEAIPLYLKIADTLGAALPAAPEARLEAARLLMEEHPAQAVEQLRKFLAERPASPRRWEALLAIATATPQDDQALQQMLQVARQCPDAPLAIQAFFEARGRALAQGEAGMETALAILQELLAKFPEMEGEKLRLARHQYLLLGLALEKPQALSWAQDFLQAYPEAAETPEVAISLGDWLASHGQFPQAIQAYRRLRQLPQAPIPLREIAAYEEAFCLAQLPDGADKAMELLRNLAATARKNPAVLAQAAFLQGDLLTQGNDPEKALEQYNLAYTQAGNSPLGLAAAGRMAELLYALGKTEEATPLADAILRAQGGGDKLLLARAKLIRARCARRQGDLFMARQYYHEIRLEYEAARGSRPGEAASPAVYVAAVNELLELLDEQGETSAANTVRQSYAQNPSLPALSAPQPPAPRGK